MADAIELAPVASSNLSMAAALEIAPVASSKSRPLVYKLYLRNKYDDQEEEKLRNIEACSKAMVPVLDHRYDCDNNNQVVPRFVIPLFKDDGPWEIKKKLKPSDVNRLSRLLLTHDMVEKHIFPYWDDERVQRWLNDENVCPMKVIEFDTWKVHHLVFKNWPTNNSYVLQGEWASEFVKDMGLEAGDQIGMFYNSGMDCLYFKLLEKHA
ncbi:putative B3 domain-containing protein At1g78640 [Papaver somniferum]|uniref:putative B3 domain-containing protein At1g78640 n=1 Tax=Papaver somniferum TaxID=3469 RepID=UPI000E6FDB26|nr:putative B3 domain-containing protein At1g78640 [Papaver somniferum]